MSVNATDVFKELGLATTARPQKKEQSLGQEQFLKLMTMQLTHQDPLKPMENGDFLGQMAQFSTVSGIQGLQASFKDFASSLSSDQALQATSLVGRSVFAPSDRALLDVGGNVLGNLNLHDSATEVNVKIMHPVTGAVVRNLELGGHAPGELAFSWDGLDAQGEFSTPGFYKVQVEAKIDGKNTILPINIQSRVESISMGAGGGGLQINLASGQSVDFSRIKQIL